MFSKLDRVQELENRCESCLGRQRFKNGTWFGPPRTETEFKEHTIKPRGQVQNLED